MKREETGNSKNGGHVHLPWEGRDDLIMTHKEYWEEIARLCPASQEELNEKPLQDMTLEELEESERRLYERLNSKVANEIFDRRGMGVKKALYEWEQGGCKGERPEDIMDLMFLTTPPPEFLGQKA